MSSIEALRKCTYIELAEGLGQIANAVAFNFPRNGKERKLWEKANKALAELNFYYFKSGGKESFRETIVI